MNRQAIALTCLLLVIVALASCQRSNLIGGVERISDKGFAEVKILSVEVTPDSVDPNSDTALDSDPSWYQWRWGSDDPADARQIREIRIQIPGRTIVLTGTALSGIREVFTDDVHVLTKGDAMLIKFSGGDAAGGYNCTIFLRDDVTKRYCESGEFGHESCESMTITKNGTTVNTHNGSF
ncbi:MAG: hypothetical protein IT442_05105 [Phycisphaeraceae bacterium]|nr:hypothetical protein [Phycisphaeraceae bacterium]